MQHIRTAYTYVPCNQDLVLAGLAIDTCKLDITRDMVGSIYVTLNATAHKSSVDHSLATTPALPLYNYVSYVKIASLIFAQ